MTLMDIIILKLFHFTDALWGDATWETGSMFFGLYVIFVHLCSVKENIYV